MAPHRSLACIHHSRNELLIVPQLLNAESLCPLLYLPQSISYFVHPLILTLLQRRSEYQGEEFCTGSTGIGDSTNRSLHDSMGNIAHALGRHCLLFFVYAHLYAPCKPKLTSMLSGSTTRSMLASP